MAQKRPRIAYHRCIMCDKIIYGFSVPHVKHNAKIHYLVKHKVIYEIEDVKVVEIDPSKTP